MFAQLNPALGIPIISMFVALTHNGSDGSLAVQLSEARGGCAVHHWSHSSRIFQLQNPVSDWQLYDWYAIFLGKHYSNYPSLPLNSDPCLFTWKGKERIFLEAARVLRKKIYVPAAKLRLLECLELPAEDMQWFTSNDRESNIHVVPMWTIASFKRLKQLSSQYSVSDQILWFA